MGTRLNEADLTRTHNICLSKNKTDINYFYLKIIIFKAVKKNAKATHLCNYCDFSRLWLLQRAQIVWRRTGLVVRASDSGSGDPGSILGRVGVLFP